MADWTRIHTLCMETVDDGFRESTNYLDEKISKLVNIIAHPPPPPPLAPLLPPPLPSSGHYLYVCVLTPQTPVRNVSLIASSCPAPCPPTCWSSITLSRPRGI